MTGKGFIIRTAKAEGMPPEQILDPRLEEAPALYQMTWLRLVKEEIWAAGDEDVRVFDGMEKAGLLEVKKMPDQLLLKVKKGTKDPDTYSWRQDVEKRWIIERWLYNFIGVYGVIERRELCRLCRKTGNDSLGTEEEFEECAKRMEKFGFFTALKRDGENWDSIFAEKEAEKIKKKGEERTIRSNGIGNGMMKN